MKCRFIISGVLFSLFLLTELFGQDTSKVEIEKQLEVAFEETEEEEGGEQLRQFLEDLAANPVNINTAGLSELLQVPGFNWMLAKAVIEHRKQKPFESVSELIKVKGIGEQTLSRMRPYIKVGEGAERFREFYTRPEYWLGDPSFSLISRFQQNLQTQEGYLRPDSSGGYLGSPVKYYQRMHYRSDHLSVNLTQEKDAGETLAGLNDFDLNSWHLTAKDNGRLKALVIGDYSLSFGQGLALWTGGAFGKGREVTGSVSKNERGLRPYSSAQETDFFRGVAATYGEHIEFTAFYSNRPRTASVISGDTIRFPSSSGFHRTRLESERKNNINQRTFGGRVKAATSFGLIGITAYTTEFSAYVSKGTAPYELFGFEGRTNSVIGIDYRGSLGNILLFGELARSKNKGIGGVTGLEAPLGTQTELSLLYRNYGKDFQSFMGSGFGESSGTPQNESGFYMGIRHQLNDRFSASTYMDQYSFPAPRFGTRQPTAGFDVLGLIEGEITEKLNIYVLFRRERKEEEYTVMEDGREQRRLGDEIRGSLRLHSEYILNRKIRLRSRAEWVRFQSPDEVQEYGFLIYQVLRLQFTDKLKLDTRITFFDTDSFDARIYQFESDLLYVLSNVALNDRGERMYVVVNYEPARWVEIWLKYSVSWYEDVHVTGSGLNEIQGNKKSFLGVQVRVRI